MARYPKQGEPCLVCSTPMPCPDHTRKGEPRKKTTPTKSAKRAKDTANVVDMFSDDKKGKQRKQGARETPGYRTLEGNKRGTLIRLGKRYSQMVQDVRDGITTWADIAEEMDAEELARGHFKASDGTFRGRPPALVPRDFFLACEGELMRRFNTALRENLQSAVEELLRLALNSEMEDKDRAKWLSYIIERVVGKVPDKLEVRAADPWETIISDIFAEVPDGAVKEPRYMKDREPDGEHT